MPKNWVLPGVGVVALIIVIVIAVLAIRGQQAPTPLQPTVPPITQPQVLSNSITVSDQAQAKTVSIESVNLNRDGYVVIHEDANGSPGKVIGNSEVLGTGTQTDLAINLTRTSREGETLYAMLHGDDGDGTYGFPDEDLPIKDDEGKVVVQKFTVATE